MGFIYSKADAKVLKIQYEMAFARLDRLRYKKVNYINEIRECIKDAKNNEVVNILSSIPVKELNNKKNGYNVKPLHDAGYTNIASILGASISTLASINGISESSASSIKIEADRIADTVSQEVRIRLSTDNKTPHTTKLIKTIYQYKHLPQLVNQVLSYDNETRNEIVYKLYEMSAGTNLFRLFASTNKTNNANKAYKYLSEYFRKGYNQQVLIKLNEIEYLEQCPDLDVWTYFAKNSIEVIKTIETIDPNALGKNDKYYGLPEILAREIKNQDFFPNGLLCSLRPYQELGVKYILHQGNVLLGDEMGLGKTVQAIATMVSLRNVGGTHFIVVCPASVLSNWSREIRKHSKLSVILVHGKQRESYAMEWKKVGGVAITTYESVGAFDVVSDFKYSMIVVDEAHYIKNENAQRTQKVKRIAKNADRMLFMTGTALENRVSEMISLIEVLQPSVASKVRGLEFMASAPAFKTKVAPVYYRRKREDVLKELPELIEYQEWCTMSREEEIVYENNVLNREYAQSRRVSWNVKNLDNSSKARRMKEIIAEAKSEGRKVIVFSFFLDTIQAVQKCLGNICTQPINGSVSPQRRQEIIDKFEKAPPGTVLLSQIQAGGTGLNIQCASVVILCEPQFKPSTENQAISRAYRMGQSRNVLVYRLLCENTVDERLMNILGNKQAIFDAFADESVAARQSKEIDNKAFGNIIENEINRIKNKRNYKSNLPQVPTGKLPPLPVNKFPVIPN